MVVPSLACSERPPPPPAATGSAIALATFAPTVDPCGPMRSRLLPGLFLTVFAVDAAAQKHPHFDDGGALAWHTRFASAKAAAGAADRLIFVEYGRKA